MHNKYKPLIVTLVAVLLYSGLQIFVAVKSKINDAPTITFDDAQLEVSVNDSEEVLLQGVHTFDSEDGDLSDSVIIEDQSVFVSDTTRKISYLVFDSNDHVTRASRLVTYRDYTSPVYTILEPLRGERYSVTEAMNKIRAYSSIDGDISKKITVMNTSLASENKLKLSLSVSDSTNTTSYLNVYYYLEKDLDIDIVLDQYLVYLDVNESFDFRNNIINVVEKFYQNEYLIHEIDIDVPDMSQSGVYEVTYSIARSNGNKGKTAMTVVVR